MCSRVRSWFTQDVEIDLVTKKKRMTNTASALGFGVG